MLVERRLIKYRGHLACSQEQICILGAWAVTLMFDIVLIWQKHSQKTLLGGKMPTVPGSGLEILLSQHIYVYVRTRLQTHITNMPQAPLTEGTSFLLTGLPICSRDRTHQPFKVFFRQNWGRSWTAQQLKVGERIMMFMKSKSTK